MRDATRLTPASLSLKWRATVARSACRSSLDCVGWRLVFGSATLRMTSWCGWDGSGNTSEALKRGFSGSFIAFGGEAKVVVALEGSSCRFVNLRGKCSLVGYRSFRERNGSSPRKRFEISLTMRNLHFFFCFVLLASRSSLAVFSPVRTLNPFARTIRAAVESISFVNRITHSPASSLFLSILTMLCIN